MLTSGCANKNPLYLLWIDFDGTKHKFRGGGGGGVQARLPEISSDNVYFSPQLILQWCLSMVYFKTIIFQAFRGDPGVQHFHGGPKC